MSLIFSFFFSSLLREEFKEGREWEGGVVCVRKGREREFDCCVSGVLSISLLSCTECCVGGCACFHDIRRAFDLLRGVGWARAP